MKEMIDLEQVVQMVTNGVQALESMTNLMNMEAIMTITEKLRTSMQFQWFKLYKFWD